MHSVLFCINMIFEIIEQKGANSPLLHSAQFVWWSHSSGVEASNLLGRDTVIGSVASHVP
jgi:hypothetical protein